MKFLKNRVRRGLLFKKINGESKKVGRKYKTLRGKNKNFHFYLYYCNWQYFESIV